MAPRLLEHRVIGVQGCANGQAFIACCRLDIGTPKGRAVEQLSVRNAVESASARHGKIVTRDALVQPVQKVEEYFLEPVLQCKGDFLVPLRTLMALTAWRLEQFVYAMEQIA